MGSAAAFFFMFTTVLSFSSFIGDGMAFTPDLSCDSDLYFSFLNLSLISVNLTSLR